jgi:hypothetical protein
MKTRMVWVDVLMVRRGRTHLRWTQKRKTKVCGKSGPCNALRRSRADPKAPALLFGGGEEEGDFAFRGMGLIVGKDLGGGASAEFFEGFCEFAGDADQAVGADFDEGGQGFFEAVGRFEEDGGFGAGGGFGEFAGAASAFNREKAAEEKAVAGKPGTDQRDGDGGGSGQDGDGQAAVEAGFDEAVAGIRDAGHAGVGDQGDVEAAGDALGEFGAAGGFVVAVQADEGFFDLEMLEEEPAVAGVLGGDKVRGAEGVNGAEGDVAAVADGGGDDAEHGPTSLR